MKLPTAREISKALGGLTAAVPVAVAEHFVSPGVAGLVLGVCTVAAGFLGPYLSPANKTAPKG